MGLFDRLFGPSFKSNVEIDAMTYEDRTQYFYEMRRHGKSINTGNKTNRVVNTSSINHELSIIDDMEGHDFEYWCANLLNQSGFSNATVTKGSDDDGVDVVALKDGYKWAFQCKRYNSALGKKPVQEVYAGLKPYNCQKGVVMTNNYFTKGAVSLAEANNIILWNRDNIIDMLSKRRWYLYEDENLWPHNRTTDKINYDYFASLPPVPKYNGMKEYIKCFPLGGETERWNPYIYFEQEGHEYSDLLLLEFYTEDFDSKEEAEHFFKAIEKRYYAIIPRGIHGSSKYNFVAYVHGNLIRDKFDAETFCWTLENWA